MFEGDVKNMLKLGDKVKVSKSVSFPRCPEGTVGTIVDISPRDKQPYIISSKCADGYVHGFTWGYSEDELELVHT